MPRGLAVDAGGTLYIADMGNHRIRAVAPDGTIRTVAGTLPPESEWKQAEPVESLFLPTLVAVGADASLFAVDRSGQRLLRLAPDGSAQGLASGRGLNSITVASDGSLLLADAAGLRTLHDGRWTPVERGAGLTVATSLDATIVAYDWRSHRIVRLHNEESNEQVAGNGTVAHFGDGGPANGATFSCYDVVVGLQGEIVFSDTLNGRVAVIRDGHIHTLALVSGALGLGYDARGVVYVADQASHRVLAIDSEGKIEPVAGNGVAGFSGDGGKATNAELSRPADVVVRADGAILISDSENERVRLVDTQGIITTLANFDRPTGSLFLHPNGQLVVSLRGGYELIEFEPTGVPALLKVAASTGGDDARSRREALAFTPHGELLFVRDGQLYGAKGSDEAYPLSLGAPSLTGTTRLAVGADDDLVLCDARQRILRVAGTRLREAVTAVALR